MNLGKDLGTDLEPLERRERDRQARDPMALNPLAPENARRLLVATFVPLLRLRFRVLAVEHRRA